MLPHLQPSIITCDTIVEIVRLMPKVAQNVLADNLRKDYEKLASQFDNRTGRWVEEALEKMNEEQQKLNQWIEQYEKGGGPLSKEEEPEYWVS